MEEERKKVNATVEKLKKKSVAKHLSTSTVLLALLMLIWFAQSSLFFTFGGHKYVFYAMIILHSFVIVFGILLIYEQHSKLIFGSKCIIESLFILLCLLDFGFILTSRTIFSGCRQNMPRVAECEHTTDEIPQDILLLFMFLPILFSIIFQRVKRNCIIFCWLLVVTVITLNIALLDKKDSISSLFFYAPISFIVLMESRRQNLEMFLIAQKLEKSLEDNETNAELHATELRHMIANVAHDLKTVCYL
jgi:hypothetical protein